MISPTERDPARNGGGGGALSLPVLRWTIRLVLAAALFAVAFNLRFQGMDWPDLHPDSGNMSRWMRWTRHHPYVRDRVYPGGFFTLFRPWQNLEAEGEVSRFNQTAEQMGLFSAPDRRLSVVLLAREFNAALGALTCLVLLALAWSVTGSFPAALFAATVTGKPLGIAVFERKRHFDITLRSRDPSLRLSYIAEKAAEAAGGSGGGHPNAAGARIPMAGLKTFLKKVNYLM